MTAHGEELPYRIACLCDLRDADGRILLIRRLRSPNKGLCSPIGGKLHMNEGESPAECARREIHEEAGLDIPPDRLHLLGLISEKAFEGKGHWLLFYYRVVGPVHLEPCDIPEGRLEWFEPDSIESLPLPETDRQVIWPLVRSHEAADGDGRLGFFAVHIDCSDGTVRWTIDESNRPSKAR